MNKILYTILTVFIFTEVSLAAMGGGSSSSSSSSSYSSSSEDSGPYMAANRFKEVNKLINLEKYAEAHRKLKTLGIKGVN